MAKSAAALDLAPGSEVQSEVTAHKAGQRALRAAFIGFFVDMFDVYLPVIVGHGLLSTGHPEPGLEIDAVLHRVRLVACWSSRGSSLVRPLQ